LSSIHNERKKQEQLSALHKMVDVIT
jgi:hypothetical protein